MGSLSSLSSLAEAEAKCLVYYGGRMSALARETDAAEPLPRVESRRLHLADDPRHSVVVRPLWSPAP